MAAVAQPAGTVTLVFTDIEQSTRLLEQLGTDAYRDALAEHRRIVREACARHDGYEVDYEGDAFFYAFNTAQAAVAAVSEAMLGLQTGPIRIRVGIHTGEPALDPPKYVGIDVHRAARIMASAHGGQVVLSRETAELLDDGHALKDLGEHRFKDLGPPERIYQLGNTEHPSLKSLYRVTLPVPSTPFLGRTRELAEVTARLADPDVRLLTLTGPGGTGKTRLALQAAAGVSGQFPDGITWVPLAPLRDSTHVIPTIAQALDLREQPEQSLADTVAQTLLGKKALLLLDNVEHLLPDAAHVLAALTTTCPTLRLLVTSRQRLQLTGETTWPVPILTDSDSVELFVQRARAALPDFEATPEVAAICATLDRLPLAIELAAARVSVLSPASILERLDGRLTLLRTRAHDVDDRQRTLEATITWSYDLLDPEEQRVFRALSVFAGGCTLEAAEQVAGADLDVLDSLLDKSLLRHRSDSGHDRYWALETIREYADARLHEADEADALFHRYLDWLDHVVGEVGESWIDRDQLAWFDELERERANLMHAVTELRRRARPDAAVRLLVAAFEFFDTRGPAEQVAELLDELTPDEQRLAASAACGRSMLLYRLGRVEDALDDARQAHRLAGAAGDDAIAARSLAMCAGLAALTQGAGQASTLADAEEAVALARSSGDTYSLAHALNGLGIVVSSVDAARARAHYAEAASLAGTIGDRRHEALCRCNVVTTSLALGRPDRVADELTGAIETMRRLGDSLLEANAHGLLGLAQVATGDSDQARASIARLVELTVEWPDEGLLVEALAVLAMAAAETDPTTALTLWAASERLRGAGSFPVAPEVAPYVVAVLEPLRDRPGSEEHWRLGSELTVEDALALGLERHRA